MFPSNRSATVSRPAPALPVSSSILTAVSDQENGDSDFEQPRTAPASAFRAGRSPGFASRSGHDGQLPDASGPIVAARNRKSSVHGEPEAIDAAWYGLRGGRSRGSRQDPRCGSSHPPPVKARRPSGERAMAVRPSSRQSSRWRRFPESTSQSRAKSSAPPARTRSASPEYARPDTPPT